MPLHDTDAQTIEGFTAAESLPDPATVSGRTHQLTNTAGVNAVWSSVGATPFTVGGVNVATLTVPPGAQVNVRSDGVHWIQTTSTSRKMIALVGTSDASGNVTFNLAPAGFAVAPVCSVSWQGASSINPVDYRITALSATSATINIRVSIGINIALLGLTLLGQSTPLSGATVHFWATEAGATP